MRRVGTRALPCVAFLGRGALRRDRVATVGCRVSPVVRGHIRAENGRDKARPSRCGGRDKARPSRCGNLTGLSPAASAVLDAGKKLYQVFYAELMNTRWMQFKIETWDVGIYQVRSALKDAGLGAAELVALKSAHDALRAKLLPQVYSLGFLNPDVEYFE